MRCNVQSLRSVGLPSRAFPQHNLSAWLERFIREYTIIIWIRWRSACCARGLHTIERNFHKECETTVRSIAYNVRRTCDFVPAVASGLFQVLQQRENTSMIKRTSMVVLHRCTPMAYAASPRCFFHFSAIFSSHASLYARFLACQSRRRGAW